MLIDRDMDNELFNAAGFSDAAEVPLFVSTSHADLVVRAFNELTLELGDTGYSEKFRTLNRFWAGRLIRYWRREIMFGQEDQNEASKRAQLVFIGDEHDHVRQVFADKKAPNALDAFTFSFHPSNGEIYDSPTINSRFRDTAYEVKIELTGLPEKRELKITSFKRAADHLNADPSEEINVGYLKKTDIIEM